METLTDDIIFLEIEAVGTWLLWLSGLGTSLAWVRKHTCDLTNPELYSTKW